ncbi:MAG: hypothetical protein P9M03_01370, partial [Candidatus Theseobacter exili]|nr:hypothetical protein [Candidatus Theseobacter exili]
VWVSRIGYREQEKKLIEKAITEAENLASLVNEYPYEEEPMFSPITVKNKTRKGTDSKPYAGVSKQDLFRNAPAVKKDYFKVANILE